MESLGGAPLDEVSEESNGNGDDTNDEDDHWQFRQVPIMLPDGPQEHDAGQAGEAGEIPQLALAEEDDPISDADHDVPRPLPGDRHLAATNDAGCPGAFHHLPDRAANRALRVGRDLWLAS